MLEAYHSSFLSQFLLGEDWRLVLQAFITTVRLPIRLRMYGTSSSHSCVDGHCPPLDAGLLDLHSMVGLKRFIPGSCIIDTLAIAVIVPDLGTVSHVVQLRALQALLFCSSTVTKNGIDQSEDQDY